VAFLAFRGKRPHPSETEPNTSVVTRLIIDTDAGVDDAIAILLALASPAHNVAAITTLSGNVDVNKVVRNVGIVLDAARADEIPIFRGAEFPLTIDRHHAAQVHGEDGLDEISCVAPTRVAEVRARKIDYFKIEPERFSLTRLPLTSLATTGPEHAVEVLRRALAGESGAAQDVLALNAGAAIYLGGMATSIDAGVQRAREILVQGQALETLERMRRASQEESG